MYPGTFISVSTGINQHDCDGVVPSKNASTAVQKIDAIAKMVRSLAGSPVVMCTFSFPRVSSELSLNKGAALATRAHERHSHVNIIRTGFDGNRKH
jgi:hypothetical protein